MGQHRKGEGQRKKKEQREKRDKKKEKWKKEKEKKEKRSDQWEREGKSDVTRLVAPSNVCLFTKMPWKLSFHKLKTPKMCFQFP